MSPDDSVTGLSLGDAAFVPLKAFLKSSAKRSHRDNIAKTYVVTQDSQPKKVVAYITLLCSHILVDSIPAEDVADHPYKDFPAVKIARLAVDSRHRKKGLGKQLVELAIATAVERIMPFVGCRFLVLDSKQESIKFYQKHGFRLVETDHNKQLANPVMFMDLGKL